MNWLDPEFVRALTPTGVLLLVVLGIAYAGYRDRNARIKEIREDRDARLKEMSRQVDTWRDAYEKSEVARDRMADGLKDALDIARTATAAVDGLRAAIERSDRENGR